MTQSQFDEDLNISYDDTGILMPFPEQEEGFLENPIRRLFENDKPTEEEE